MRILQAFKLAWQSILGSKMRSFLTMLGMIIGVGSVITLLGLMQGATNYLIDTFSELGTNVLSVSVTNTDTRKVTADDCIYIAYSNATRLAGSSDISRYTFVTKDSSAVSIAEKFLDNYLYNVYKDEDLYTITTSAKLLDTINSMTTILSSILGGIAGISLLVAGIGIMNIMLVSVVERTKEIGIRKSLGARRSDIMLQFVIEAASISMLGGAIGIIIGYVATGTIGNAVGVSAAPTTASILLAFGVSAAIGIGFGYAPASKASKLNPIDALRSE